MKTDDLDRLIHQSLTEEARRAHFDPDGWAPSITSGAPRTARRSATWRRAGVAVAAALVAAAVAIPLVLLSPLRRGPADDPPPARTVGRPADLWGERFRAASIVEDGEPRPLVPGTHLDVSFARRKVAYGPNADPRPDRPDRGSIGWSIGCNGHGSMLRITPDRLLIDERGVSTLMLCQGALGDQERWAERFFSSDPQWRLDGDVLTLSSGTTVIELRRRGGGSTPETSTHADTDDGISITIPSDWTFHQEPSGPPGPSTRTLFAVGSWAFPGGGDCAPTEALSAMPADGVLLWINETDPELSAAHVVPRPERFDLDDAPSIHPPCSPTPYTYQWFEENGRYLQINVAYGPSASEARRQDVLRALDSMALTAPVPDGCPVDVGPWADPDCPAQAWVRALVEDAGYSVNRDTGSALVAAAEGVRFYIHATPAGPARDVELVPEETESFAETVRGYGPPITFEGTDVYLRDGSAAWTAQGFHVWISPYLFDALPTSAIERLVRSSKLVDYDSIDTR